MPPTAHAGAPARVLLVNLNQYDQPYPVYPVGLAYIDGALRAAGYATRVWDGRVSAAPLAACVGEFAPDFVGISMRNLDSVQSHNPLSFVRDLVDCCRELRRITRAPIILGGSAFSVFPDELLELTGADFGVAGEGEAAVVALLDRLRTGRPPGALPGLLRRDGNGRIRRTPGRAAAAAFRAAPAHDPTVLRAYVAQGSLPGVQTQRGCPLRCCYCTYPLIEGVRSRFRSGAAVAEEMAQLAAQGVRYAFLVDSVFNTSQAHVADVCEALRRAKLDLEWECFLRPHGLTRDLLLLMREAGLRHVEFGSDSLSDPVLAAYGKSFRFADIERSSALARELGLNYSHFVIFGGPGETPATVEETLARARTLRGAFFFGTIGMRIYPGTPLWSRLDPESHGQVRADFLVEPRFHLEPPFTVDGLYRRLREVQRTEHNWAIGDPPPRFAETVRKLRTRGVRGPMWEYIELLQRMGGGPA